MCPFIVLLRLDPPNNPLGWGPTHSALVGRYLSFRFRFIGDPLRHLQNLTPAGFIMSLSRLLAIRDGPEPSSSRPRTSWSERFLRRKDEVESEQSQGAPLASNGSPPRSSQKTGSASSAPLTTPNALRNPQDRCPLFKLPYELRIVFYKLFLQKSQYLVADDEACSRIFRQNSRLMNTEGVYSRSRTLRFAHFYQNDDDPFIWCSRTPGSQSRPYEYDRMGDMIIRPYSTNLMSTCKKICDEMALLLYARKTLVLAHSSLLLNIKEEYFSPRSFAQVQHLHINQSWSERDDSWVRDLHGQLSLLHDIPV